MLRIIAGKFKGKKLLVPDVSRPITDRIRTSMFDTLSPIINGANILDLYAGSGAFGLEAISRGANSATFVENSDEAISLLKKNIENLQPNLRVQIIQQKVASFLESGSEEKFDIVMIDPPFPMPLVEKVENVKNAAKLLNNGGVIVFRLPSKENYDVNIPDLVHIFSNLFPSISVDDIFKDFVNFSIKLK